MQANKTVTINGRMYDAVTGLPLEKKATPAPIKPTKPAAAPAKHSGHVNASSVHATTQRSQTLHRRAAKKPTAVAKRPQPGRRMDISRSHHVSRFAPHPASSTARKADTPDVQPKTHPTVAKAVARSTAAKPVAKTSKQVKDAVISAALSAPTLKPIKQKRINWRWSRRFTILSTVFALLIIGGIFTYANLPVLSVGFASAQAGIKATYPEYRPDGYSLSQPVTYSDGEVTLVFKSNSADAGYTIVQTRSSWDSSAVLDNVVRKSAGDNYVTTQEKGLIIYTYDQNAAWVNGGILYKIKTTAPLSGEQIRRIASSL